ncbi:MAG TPA: hypothetical protein VGQ39_04330 [Pyrinomonadaceae bacterium]|jgi:hypothetical protein|nr:hypothetical protein [Pyrinomonadaceae bacterium]
MTSKHFAYCFAALLALLQFVASVNAFEECFATGFQSRQLQAFLIDHTRHFNNVVSNLASKAAGSQIQITEIKIVGESAAKETHSIVQVSWTIQGAPEVKVSSFELLLEITYADGFVEKAPAKTTGNVRSSRFEVPTLHRFANQPAAEMKSFKVSITANSSETTTKQISL